MQTMRIDCFRTIQDGYDEQFATSFIAFRLMRFVGFMKWTELRFKRLKRLIVNRSEVWLMAKQTNRSVSSFQVSSHHYLVLLPCQGTLIENAVRDSLDLKALRKLCLQKFELENTATNSQNFPFKVILSFKSHKNQSQSSNWHSSLVQRRFNIKCDTISCNFFHAFIRFRSCELLCCYWCWAIPIRA